MKPLVNILCGTALVLLTVEKGFCAPIQYDFNLDESHSVGTIGYGGHSASFNCAQDYDCDYLFEYRFAGSLSITVDTAGAWYSAGEDRYYGAVDVSNVTISAGSWESATSLNGSPAWPTGGTPPAGYEEMGFGFPGSAIDSWIDGNLEQFTVIFGSDLSASISGNLNGDPTVLSGREGCYFQEVGACVNALDYSFTVSEVPLPGAVFLYMSGLLLLPAYQKLRIHKNQA